MRRMRNRAPAIDADTMRTIREAVHYPGYATPETLAAMARVHDADRYCRVHDIFDCPFAHASWDDNANDAWQTDPTEIWGG